MTLVDKIRKFGELSYDAGVHEKEEDFIKYAELSKECFHDILRYLKETGKVEQG